MREATVKKFKIKELWSFCEEGKFAIPEIQREFVWDAKRSRNFLNSIYRRFPIGALITWELVLIINICLGMPKMF